MQDMMRYVSFIPILPLKVKDNLLQVRLVICGRYVPLIWNTQFTDKRTHFGLKFKHFDYYFNFENANLQIKRQQITRSTWLFP
jgi:hypothetical protein